MVLSMNITVTFLTSISIDFWGQLNREFLENWCSTNYNDSTCINFQEIFEKKKFHTTVHVLQKLFIKFKQGTYTVKITTDSLE